MVGYYPDTCPFCGTCRDKITTAAECSQRFSVTATPVNDRVVRYNSVPSLGLEHAAYRIDTGTSIVWIDCPSTFDNRFEPADIITFTHHHFLGASNMYQEFFPAKLRIHQHDSASEICRGYPFDQRFKRSHEIEGIQTYHINCHTPGCTCYLYGNILLACDYVFQGATRMNHNPFGPRDKTKNGGKKIKKYSK